MESNALDLIKKAMSAEADKKVLIGAFLAIARTLRGMGVPLAPLLRRILGGKGKKKSKGRKGVVRRAKDGHFVIEDMNDIDGKDEEGDDFDELDIDGADADEALRTVRDE